MSGKEQSRRKRKGQNLSEAHGIDKNAMISEFENELKKLAISIKEVGETEVDLFADDNLQSPYVRHVNMIKEFWKSWKVLVQYSGCSPFLTGRKMEKKVRLNQLTEYTHLNKKIEDYLNKKPYSFVPDFSDIKNVILHECHELEGGQNLNVDEVTRKFHDHIIKLLRSRRLADLFESVKDICGEDPALHDSSLQRKLQQNEVIALQNIESLRSTFGRRSDSCGEGDNEGSDEENDDFMIVEELTPSRENASDEIDDNDDAD